jgi:hypothetical protein
MAERSRPAWQGSTRRARLPANWGTEIKPRAREANPQQICHWCGAPGGTSLDHKDRGDAICQAPGQHQPLCQCNLDWIHDYRDVQRGVTTRNCHGEKTGREGAAARTRIARPPEQHPAFGGR